MIITISGTQGSGKSTISKILRDNYDFDIIKVSDIMRNYAKEQGISLLEANKRNETTYLIDQIMDSRTIELAKEIGDKNTIFDSRMAWHFIPDSFKIFVKTDDETAAKRIMNDQRDKEEQYKDLEEAKIKIKQRRESESKRYKELYNVDNLDLDNYDLVLDSTHQSAEELAEIIIDEIRKKYWFI